MATLTQVELWTSYQADGGTRVTTAGFFPVPSFAEDDLGVDGQDRARAGWPKSLPKAAQLTRGRVLRFVWDDATWAEWEIDKPTVASGTEDALYTVDLLPVQDRLRRVPVEFTDGDGFVFHEVPAFHLTPTVTVEDVLFAQAPAWFTTGTITPTERTEVQFSSDNALSGLVKYAQSLGADYWFTPGASSYALNLGVRGGSADPVRFRGGKNIRQVRRTVGGDQVTRVRAFGAEGDDGGASTLGWAYVKVTGLSGALVTLGPIHGTGGDLIGYDDQFNHANLGATIYLEKIDGSLTAIVDTTASTQQVQVASATGITVGDWVRLVASSGGKHLTFLDAPAEIAAHGVRPGDCRSEWDDTLNLIDNPLFATYTTSPGTPDGFSTAAGTLTRETATGNWITAGQSCKVVLGTGVTAAFLSRAKSWRIPKRRSTFSAIAWIRPTALSGGTIGFRLTVNGSPVGEELLYRSPLNQWVQLKVEGLSLASLEGLTRTIGFELRAVLDPGSGAVTGTVYVDSVQVSPSVTARPITHGANATRVWQQALQYLDEHRPEPVALTYDVLDLARAGIPRTAAIEVGGTAIADVEELNLLGVSGRVLRRRRDLINQLLTEVTVATVATALPKRLASPTPLTIPFFDPVRSVAAGRDTRQAVQLLKAEITATAAATVTITLTHSDLLNGSPTISYVVYGSVAYVSGSGLGPYVFTRPTTGGGLGAVIFTSKIPGRSDVSVPVEIPENGLDTGVISGVISTKSGQFDYRLEGGYATASWRVAVSTSSMPADATVDAASPINGRVVAVTNYTTLALDGLVYLKARPYSAASGGGQAGDYIQATFRRDTKNTVGKIDRLPVSDFIPHGDDEEFYTYVFALTFGGGTLPVADLYGLTPRTSGGQTRGSFPIRLPPGVTLTLARAYLTRGSGSGTAEVAIERVDPATGALDTTLATLTQGASTSGWVSSGALSHVVSSAYNYVARVTLVNPAATEFNVTLRGIELTYTAPDYETTK